MFSKSLKSKTFELDAKTTNNGFFPSMMNGIISFMGQYF